jgi:hypothetical protein
MNIARLTPKACTIRYYAPALTSDDHNDPDPTFTELASYCMIFQRQRAETDEGDVSSTTYIVTLRPGIAPPHAADQLDVDGVTYEFRGDPGGQLDRHGVLSHFEATCVKAS